MTLALACALAPVLWLVAAPGADAYKLGGRPWPGSTVTYYSHGDARSAALVDRAARAWNRARVGVRLRRRSRSRADVIVSGGAARCRARALVGYVEARPSRVYVGRCGGDYMMLIIAHEFGHVLGLGHERRRCALMNPHIGGSGTPSRCRNQPLGYWLRQPLLRDDIRGARALSAQSAIMPAAVPASALLTSPVAGISDAWRFR